MSSKVEPDGHVQMSTLWFFAVVFFVELIVRILSKTMELGSVHKMKRLKREIVELRKEAVPFNNPSSFAKYAKLERKAAAKEKEVEKLKAKWEAPKYVILQKVPMIMRLIVWSLLLYDHGKVPVLKLERHMVWPIGSMLSFPYGAEWMGGGAVSSITWLLLCYRFSHIIVASVLPL